MTDYTCSRSGKHVCFQFGYRNESYPKEYIYSPNKMDLEMFLRECVSQYITNVVVVLPKSVNFKWTMDCFKEQSISFYPNLKNISYSTHSFRTISFVAYELQFTYRIGTVMLKKMELEVSAEIKRLSNLLFTKDMPDNVKCFIAHNYLASTVFYFNNKDANSLDKSFIQSAYGALLQKKCVCQGYAEAYKRILNEVGISCDLICGKIVSDGELHAWNIVHLNENRTHYHVDVTWDSKGGRSDTAYFLKGDTFFDGKREWNKFYYTPCSDGKMELRNIKQYCTIHKKELVKQGICEDWIR